MLCLDLDLKIIIIGIPQGKIEHIICCILISLFVYFTVTYYSGVWRPISLFHDFPWPWIVVGDLVWVSGLWKKNIKHISYPKLDLDMVRPQAHHLHIKAGAIPYDLDHLVGHTWPRPLRQVTPASTTLAGHSGLVHLGRSHLWPRPPCPGSLKKGRRMSPLTRTKTKQPPRTTARPKGRVGGEIVAKTGHLNDVPITRPHSPHKNPSSKWCKTGRRMPAVKLTNLH